MKALLSGSAETLYIAHSDLSENSQHVQSMFLQLLRIAIQQSIPVEFIRSGKLIHECNGVSCIASSPVNSRFSHQTSIAA